MTVSKSVDITYVPSDCGSIIPGKSKAPAAFRDVGIVSKLREAGISSISEHEALDSPATYKAVAFEPGSVRNEDLNVLVCQRVKDALSKNLGTAATPSSSTPSDGRDHNALPFQLILGGECSMLPAILSAFWQHADGLSPTQRVGLIYIDADTDLASPTDPNSTGNLAGMNFTHLIQSSGALQSMQQFCRPSTGEAVCSASNTALFGTNMAAPGNKRTHFEYLFNNNYQVITSGAVSGDPERCAAEALRHLEDNKVDIIMVHLDVDAIDPQMFPLANLPNFTGVGFDTMMRALGVFLASDKVHSLTVAEVNPDHDPGLEMVGRLTDRIVGMLASRGSLK